MPCYIYVYQFIKLCFPAKYYHYLHSSSIDSTILNGKDISKINTRIVYIRFSE